MLCMYAVVLWYQKCTWIYLQNDRATPSFTMTQQKLKLMSFIKFLQNARKKHPDFYCRRRSREEFRNDRPIFGNWRIVRNEPKVARAIRAATGSALVMQVDLKTRWTLRLGMQHKSTVLAVLSVCRAFIIERALRGRRESRRSRKKLHNDINLARDNCTVGNNENTDKIISWKVFVYANIGTVVITTEFYATTPIQQTRVHFQCVLIVYNNREKNENGCNLCYSPWKRKYT